MSKWYDVVILMEFLRNMGYWLYYFNLLSIITLFYHMYIEYEIHDLAYNTKNVLHENLFLNETMCKWDGVVIFTEFLRNMGYWLYVKS